MGQQSLDISGLSRSLDANIKSSQDVGEAQSAFVQGRNIVDGVVLLNEIIEDAKRRNVRSLIFKVDFAKAYDSIDWGYLSEMLERLGFPEKWKDWMMECVTSATANVLVNGSPSGEFALERGIRQGDPLSPFLFLAAAEGLNLLTNQAVNRGLLQPVEVGKDRIKVSHLQYADDTLFVVQGSEENARAIKWILKFFELISGLQVNYNKCRLFGINLPNEEVNGLANLLGCQVGSCPVDYLGLKVGGGLTRLFNWTDLVDKTRKRLSGWNAECLSMGGRVTLINSVMTAVPIYRMAFAPIPAGTARMLKSLQIRFLWGEKEGGAKKIAWVKWENVCRIKRDGGLGVKDMRKFNLAFVGKWWWRALTDENSLWARVVRSRWGGRVWEILKGRTVLDKKAGSGWWSRIETALERETGRWFTTRLGKSVGDGGSTYFWLDRWCGDKTLKVLFPRLFQLNQNKDGFISEMGSWVNGVWRWNFQWRRALIDREKAMVEEMEKAVEGVNLKEDCSDRWTWGEKSNANYSVKEAYRCLLRGDGISLEHECNQGMFRDIWRSIAPFKYQVLAWRVLRDRIPTRDNLHRRINLSDEVRLCPCCMEEWESANHLLVRCNEVDKIWSKMVEWVGGVWAGPATLRAHFMCFTSLILGKNMKRKLGGLWICIIWVIWRWRNKVIFTNWEWNFKTMEDEIKTRFWSWCVVKGFVDQGGSYLTWSSKTLCNTWANR